MQGICRNTSCYPGKILNNNKCLPLLTITNNLRYVFTVSVIGHIPKTIDVRDFVVSLKWEFENQITQALETSGYILEDVILLTNSSCDGHTARRKKDYSIETLAYIKIFVEKEVDRLQAEQKLIALMNVTLQITYGSRNYSMRLKFDRRSLQVPVLLHEANFERNCYLHYSNKFEENVLSIEQFRLVHVAPLLICKQTTFESREFRQTWDKLKLYLVNYDLKLEFDEFQIMSDGSARVCVDRVSEFFAAVSNIPFHVSALSILTLVCISISIICLILTLITYLLFRTLRILPGKNNICLIVTLLTAQTTMLILPYVQGVYHICIIFGSLSHFAWLSYFASLTICSFHMFRVFAGKMTSNNDTNASANKTLAKYCLFSFGVPACIVLLVVCISLASSSGTDSGYSSHRCFISHKNVFLATLLTPLILMCLSNVVFFVFTAIKIRNRPKVQKSKPDNLQFIVYCKLFVLTGLTWVIQVIDTFLIESVLSYLSVIFNCSQGSFIFLSYACNKRVFILYKQLFQTKKSLDITCSSSETRANTTECTSI